MGLLCFCPAVCFFYSHWYQMNENFLSRFLYADSLSVTNPLSLSAKFLLLNEMLPSRTLWPSRRIRFAHPEYLILFLDIYVVASNIHRTLNKSLRLSMNTRRKEQALSILFLDHPFISWWKRKCLIAKFLATVAVTQFVESCKGWKMLIYSCQEDESFCHFLIEYNFRSAHSASVYLKHVLLCRTTQKTLTLSVPCALCELKTTTWSGTFWLLWLRGYVTLCCLCNLFCGFASLPTLHLSIPTFIRGQSSLHMYWRPDQILKGARSVTTL